MLIEKEDMTLSIVKKWVSPVIAELPLTSTEFNTPGDPANGS